MKKIPFFSLLLFIFILYSCEYQSDEVYNRPVNRDVAPPHIQVVELNIDEDTLFVYQSREIKFKFHSDNQAIRLVRFLVDGEVIGIVYSDYGNFELPVRYIGEGLHDFSIEIYTGAGTGSLADELGIEGYLSSNTWKLLIQNNYYPVIIKTIENGLLHLKWNAFHGSDFKEYIISKWGENYNETEIARTGTNEFIDNSYVGEETKYFVRVQTKGDLILIPGELHLSDDLPRMFFSAEDTNKYFVKWNRTKYYNAVDSYVLFQGYESDITNVKSTDNINDTIHQVTDGIFGDLARFKLRIVPKKINIQYYPGAYGFFESSVLDYLGFCYISGSDYLNSYYLKVNKDEFIYFSCDTLTRYSISQRRTVEKFCYRDPDGCRNCYQNAQISNSGKFMVSYVGCNRDILLAKGSDFQQHSVHKLQGIPTEERSNMAVSDAGIAIINNGHGGLNLYDLSTSASLGFYQKNYFEFFSGPVKISPTGEYFLILSDTVRLVQFKNGKFTDIWKSMANGNEFYDFDPRNPNQLVIWHGSKLSTRLCSDFSLVSEISLKEDGLVDIDYTTGEILTYSEGHLFVRSFSDGSLIKDVPVNFNPFSESDKCYLIGHTIVYSDRRLLYFI